MAPPHFESHRLVGRESGQFGDRTGARLKKVAEHRGQRLVGRDAPRDDAAIGQWRTESAFGVSCLDMTLAGKTRPPRSAIVVLVSLVVTAIACGSSTVVPRPVAEPRCPAPAPAPSGLQSLSVATSSSGSLEETEAAAIQRINANDIPGLQALFAPTMRAAFPEEKLRPFVTNILNNVGAIVSSELDLGDRSARYSLKAQHGERLLDLQVDKDGKITSLRITSPAAPYPPRVARSAVALVLPFRGQWSVRWGGDTLDVNHHVFYLSQQRAADLVVLGPDGKTYRGDGKRNEDYYAYGQEVLAVADGTVIMAIDGVPENEPGSENQSVVGGNSVTVQHTDTLFSVYAHLQPGKRRVRAGTKVKAGTVLGLCGNSGNATEPHLHFQMEDAPLFQMHPSPRGVEPVFANVTVERKGNRSTMPEYTFLKGDLVGDPIAVSPVQQPSP